MDLAELRSRRLFAQGLRGPVDSADASDAPGVVHRALAVQSQEYLAAQWGLAARLPSDGRPGLADVSAAIDRGELLRTHVLRPTWHFVHPADARWLIGLSAERVHRANGTYYRRLGLEGAEARAALDVIADTVSDGQHRTRAELGAALDAAGGAGTGLALGYAVILAELERVVISGANAGKQRTYAAFDERVPPAPARPRDEALAELVERYLLTRGPASVRDVSAWSGFGLGDIRAALVDAADRTGGRIEPFAEPELWHDASVSAAWSARPPERRDAEDPARIDLLQAYDEYIMGYSAPRAYLQPPGRTDPVIPEFPLHALMAGGVMVGRWAPSLNGRRATLRLVPWRRLSAAEEGSLAASIAEVETFLGAPATLEREAPLDG